MDKLQRLSAIAHMAISVVCGIIAYVASTFLISDVMSSLMCAWVVFCMVQIGISWYIFTSTSPAQTKAHANFEDAGRASIFLLVLLSTFAGLLAVFILLAKVRDQQQTNWVNVVLCMLGMFLSWFLVHTLYTTRYAHLYYDEKNGKIAGGLKFPEDRSPDFIDFAYHSFVIGMTFQVSDVTTTTRQMRHITLWHSLISFIFNTCIVALTINAVAGLLG